MIFKDRIEASAGSIGDDELLQQYVDESVRLVIGELPEDVLLPLATDYTDPDGTTGVDLTGVRIIKAHKAGYPARRVEASLLDRLTNETNGYPVFYVSGNTGHVLPDGGIITGIEYFSALISASTVSGVPPQVVDLVINRASQLCVDYLMAKARADTVTDITLPSPPSAVASPSISYSAASAVAPTAVTIANLPTAPVYTAPTLGSKPSVPTVSTLDLTKKVDGTTTLAPPSPPSSPSISYSDAVAASVSSTSIASLPSAPTYTAPSFGGSFTLPTLPTLDLSTEDDGSTLLAPPTAPSAPSFSYTSASSSAVSATTIAALGTAPAYTKPTFGGSLSVPTLPSLDLTKEVDGVTSLDPPTAPAQPSIAFTDASIGTFSASGQIGTLPALASMSEASFGGSIGSITTAIPSAIDLTKDFNNTTALAVPTAPAIPALTSGTLTASTLGDLGTAPAMTAATADLDFTEYATFEGLEDPEMMSSILNKLATELNEYRAERDDAHHDYMADAEAYRGTVQGALAQLTADVQSNIATLNAADQMALQDYVQELNRYDKALGQYQATVRTRIENFNLEMSRATSGLVSAQQLFVSEYQISARQKETSHQGIIQDHIKEADRIIQQASLDQDRLALMFKSETDVNIQNEIQTAQALVQDYQADLGRYQAQLSTFSAEMARVKEEWEINYKKAVEPWQIEQSTQLQLYSQDIQNELNEFNKELSAYQQDANQKVEQARITLQKSLNDAKSSTDVDVQNKARALEAEITEYDKSLSRFQAQVSTYSSEIERQIQTYSLAYQKAMDPYEKKLSLELQKYNVDLKSSGDAYSGAIQDHMREADRILQQAQITAQEASNTAQLSTEASIRNEAETAATALQNYSGQLSLYSAKVELYNLELQAVLQHYTTTLDRSIQLFGAESEVDISRFRSQVESASQDFQEDLAVYQATIERSRFAAEIARQEAQQTASQSTEVAVVNAARSMEALVAQYQATLQKHSEDLKLYSEQSQVALNNAKVSSDVISNKLRMLNFDRSRLMEAYLKIRNAYIRFAWPRRSVTIQQPVI